MYKWNNEYNGKSARTSILNKNSFPERDFNSFKSELHHKETEVFKKVLVKIKDVEKSHYSNTN